ncbi:L,D-transpeptidase family protein [Nemorincola caseinilytica]|uniref:L,D-transpeptidase family protein n=1 Tax=Nemorincola caseinilytica TaxID=2054315 RepID=A0ABP8NGP5_9BACT
MALQQMHRHIPRYYIQALLCVICILCAHTVYAQGTPADLRVLEEHKNASGDLVRTIQYTENGKRIVETRVIRPIAKLNIPIKPDTLDQQQMMLVINKTRAVLDVYYRRTKVRSYKVVFGPKPQENKVMKGDRRTPEGWFLVENKHASARYNKFMQLDYPNDSSRARFNMLKAKGLIPQNAEIGGDVGIHGVWKGGDDMIEMGVGWTDGCIALKNKDMDELYSLVGIGVRVLVRK